jgi:muramoyltetrapeptide carboxypeptidase
VTPLLPPGARIAAIALSHTFFEDRYAAGAAWIRTQGYELVEPPDLRARHRFLAGDDDHRLGALRWAMTAPDIDAVWAVRGGSGATRLLARIPWGALVPKPVLGFSDLTPLLWELARRGLPAVHAPVIHSLGATDPESLAHLAALLAGRPTAPLVGTEVVAGEAEGPIVGGNLCMIAAACGTPYQLDAGGAILVLEEIGELPYKVDRMFQQLTDAGVFDGVAGVALGTFSGCDAPTGSDYALSDVLDDRLRAIGAPAARGLPIGHGPENRAFVVGGRGRLSRGGLRLAPPQNPA